MSKRPHIEGASPQIEKIPRVAAAPTGDGKPVWRIGRLDAGGDWCAHEMSETEFRNLLKRLHSFESMRWREIEGPDSHFVEVAQIIPEARSRLSDLKLDDFDQLFSLRIGSKPRLWGMRINDIFLALWWDPDHEICPSPKKHT